MRSKIVTVFTEAIANAARCRARRRARYGEIGNALLPTINPDHREVRPRVTSFNIENVSLPPEGGTGHRQTRRHDHHRRHGQYIPLQQANAVGEARRHHGLWR